MKVIVSEIEFVQWESYYYDISKEQMMKIAKELTDVSNNYINASTKAIPFDPRVGNSDGH